MIDIAIVGGGGSGLWLLHRLRSLGYDAHLFERTALGFGQTIACQGVIHSGAKYTSSGFEMPKDNPLAAMPARWRKCFAGLGEVDLRGVQVLGEQMLFKGGELIPLAGEPVIEIKSLIRALCRPVQDYIYLGSPPPARLTIYTCGLGNESFTSQTQRRPLRMFMVRPNPFGKSVFLHWTGKEGKPGMTITTHGDVLYLGGNVAEKAVGLSEEASFIWAKSEIQYRFPLYRWNEMQWAYHDVIRAEPDNGGKLPEAPKVTETARGIVAWPCKLAMAPLLADHIIAGLMLLPMGSAESRLRLNLPSPEIARYPWETARWT